MQKIINVLAILSFAGVAGIVGGGTYLFFQKDALIKDLTGTLVEGAIGGITDKLPDILDAGLPEVTGPAVPLQGGLPTMP